MAIFLVIIIHSRMGIWPNLGQLHSILKHLFEWIRISLNCIQIHIHLDSGSYPEPGRESLLRMKTVSRKTRREKPGPGHIFWVVGSSHTWSHILVDILVMCTNKFRLLFKVSLSRILCVLLVVLTQTPTEYNSDANHLQLVQDYTSLRAQFSARLPLHQMPATLWRSPGHPQFWQLAKIQGFPRSPQVQ